MRLLLLLLLLLLHLLSHHHHVNHHGFHQRYHQVSELNQFLHDRMNIPAYEKGWLFVLIVTHLVISQEIAPCFMIKDKWTYAIPTNSVRNANGLDIGRSNVHQRYR
jgi:hypothetical protein